MDRDEVILSKEIWNERHSHYDRETIAVDDWLAPFESIIEKCSTPILDLGCGSGNDTLYFIGKGKKVIACDQSENAIGNIIRNFPEIHGTRCFNMLDGFDFEDNSFEIVCADLCLHYFTSEDTERILGEIKRVLVPGGHVFVRVNSIKDTNHGSGEGEEIEPHLFKVNLGLYKRFFDEEDVAKIFSDFEIEFCEEQDMGRYDSNKIVYTVCLRG